MPSVFLSYSRADLPLIEQLAARLRASSPEILIWRDQEKIYGGQQWPKVLGEAIADQEVFLLAWSKNSAIALFVELEWNTAIALKRTIISCLLDDTPLAVLLRVFLDRERRQSLPDAIGWRLSCAGTRCHSNRSNHRAVRQA